MPLGRAKIAIHELRKATRNPKGFPERTGTGRGFARRAIEFQDDADEAPGIGRWRGFGDGPPRNSVIPTAAPHRRNSVQICEHAFQLMRQSAALTYMDSHRNFLWIRQTQAQGITQRNCLARRASRRRESLSRQLANLAVSPGFPIQTGIQIAASIPEETTQ